MILVNPFPNCAFWSGAGVSSALQGALRKTFTHFVNINAFFQVLGVQQKSDPLLNSGISLSDLPFQCVTNLFNVS